MLILNKTWDRSKKKCIYSQYHFKRTRFIGKAVSRLPVVVKSMLSGSGGQNFGSLLQCSEAFLRKAQYCSKTAPSAPFSGASRPKIYIFDLN